MPNPSNNSLFDQRYRHDQGAPIIRRLMATLYDLILIAVMIVLIINLTVFSIKAINPHSSLLATMNISTEITSTDVKKPFSKEATTIPATEKHTLIYINPESKAAWFQQIIPVIISLLYFSFFWTRKRGQTLGMRAWKIYLINQSGNNLSWPLAIRRYGLASLSWAIFGVGIVWMLFDKDRQPLHDRILNTRLLYQS